MISHNLHRSIMMRITKPSRFILCWVLVALILAPYEVAFALKPGEQKGGKNGGQKTLRLQSKGIPPGRFAAAGRHSDARVTWDTKRGIPSLITGTNLLSEVAGPSAGGQGIIASEDLKQKAVRVMGVMSDVYGVKDAAKEFSHKSTHGGAGGYRHVRLDQVYKGLKVVGSEVVVHFDASSSARAVNGVYRSIGDIDAVPRIAPGKALDAAYADQKELGKKAGTTSQQPELVIYARDVDPVLAYQLTIVYDDGKGDAGRWRYWIDASSGVVIRRYNDVPSAVAPPTSGGVSQSVTGDILYGEGGITATVQGWSQNGIYYLWNNANMWSVYNSGGGVHATDPDARDQAWRNAPGWGISDQAEMSAARNFEAIVDYYLTVHGRNSFDDDGAMARAKVHYGSDYVNAFYNGVDFTFGDGGSYRATELCVLDVAGHEFQHGVTDYSAGLIYDYVDSGALNESFSDIFATLVEFYCEPDGSAAYPYDAPGTADWLIGEDCWLSSRALRDMRNPTNILTVGAWGQQPTRYLGTYWDDWGEMHQNAGVQNFFFYLLCEGGKGTNDGVIAYAVPGVGLAAGEKLAYLTLTGYMTPDTDYQAARDCWLAAARELDAAGVTSNSEMSVVAAWAAVGIGTFDYVLPNKPFTSGGEAGLQPYLHSNMVYQVMNPEPMEVSWTNSNGGTAWLKVEPASLIIPSNSMGCVTVSVDQAVAATLAEGIYNATVTFTSSNGIGSTNRTALLRIARNYKIRSNTYNWIDPVLGSHTQVGAYSGVSEALAIPFSFSFYHVPFSSIYATAYGSAGFSDWFINDPDNTDLSDNYTPNNLICPLWDKLGGAHLPGKVYYHADPAVMAPNRRVIITWMNVMHDDDPYAQFSFQMILKEGAVAGRDNDIIFQYNNVAENRSEVGSGKTATIGLEDEYGALFSKYSFNGERWVANQTALKFTQSPAPDVTAPIGSIRALSGAGSNATFAIAFNEYVDGLDASDIILQSTVPGIMLGPISGGGMRFEVQVTNVTTVGRILMSVVGGAVVDMSGNPNAAFGPACYVVPLDEVNFEDNMEEGPALWTASVDDYELFTTKAWECGVPNYAAGPATAFSGTNCWGTILTNDYPNGMNAWVMSPAVNVESYPVLEFYIWHDLEVYDGPVDFGYLEVDAGSGWAVVDTYTRKSRGWEYRRISLDNDVYGNRFIRVRFRATSDYERTVPGVYFDDFVVKSHREPGIWVLTSSPTNGAPGTAVPVTFVAYNSATNQYSSIRGTVDSADAGVTIANPSLYYGAMSAGSVVTAASPVVLNLGAAGNFQKPTISLLHQAWAGATEVSHEYRPFRIDGIVAAITTNRIVAKSTTGVTNWLGRFLPGDGSLTSCVFQVISAGANGIIDPPVNDTGQVAGDDVLLYTSGGTTESRGRFGEGGVAAGYGQFIKSFDHGQSAGTKLYVRAWDSSSFASATARGDSRLYTLLSNSVQTNDFGSWVVGTPVNATNDSNGDSIADGYCVLNGMDPLLPIAPLPPSWVFAASPMGSKGTGSGQFSSVTPSPTRLFYKGSFLYVLDTGNNRVQVWNRFTRQYVSSYGTQGTNNSMFNRPYGLAIDPREGTNRFAVADQGNARIQVFSFNPATGGGITFLFAFGSYGTAVSQFQKPTDVAIGPDGRIYVSDERTTQAGADDSSVRVFSSAGIYLSTLSSSGTLPSKVTKPWGVCVGPDGQQIVADTVNDRIQSWNSSGGFMWANGFSSVQPRGAQVGIGGRIYVADTGNSQIHVVRPNGSLVATLSSQGGVAGQSMNRPYGLMPVTNSPLIYVADTYNGRVLTITAIYDGDGDGMDDIWEELNGLDPDDPADAMVDGDGDGLLNIGEYRLQQDPGLPPIRISIPSLTPMQFQWGADQAGDVFRVEYISDLVNGLWQPFVVVTANVAGPYTWTNVVVSTNRCMFFRVIQLIQ